MTPKLPLGMSDLERQKCFLIDKIIAVLISQNNPSETKNFLISVFRCFEMTDIDDIEHELAKFYQQCIDSDLWMEKNSI